jgi:hypothetical protein
MTLSAPNDDSRMLLITPQILKNDYDNGRCRKDIQLLPHNRDSWTFTQVQLFFNNLTDFDKPERSRIVEADSGPYFSLKIAHSTHKNFHIRFTFHFITTCIEMTSSMDWIRSCWDMYTISQESTIGTQQRKCSKKRTKEFYYFVRSIDISRDSSVAIKKRLTPFYYSLEEFSNVYQGFISLFCRCKHIQWIDDYDRSFMYEFYTTWIDNSSLSTLTTYETFMSESQGYFKFIISERADGDNSFFSYSKNDKQYSIIGGIYISPFAASICGPLNKEIFDGLLMDATWKTIKGYVTSILIGSVCNVGIPLSFSFGPGETKELYELFYSTFADVIGVDLTKYIVESDGGSALAAVAAERGQFHLICHHHYLRSLKSTEFSYQIGALVSCRCEIDLQNLLDEYSKEFSNFVDDIEKMGIIQKKLETCGMQFNLKTKRIEIHNTERWALVSLVKRVECRMPSTTNSLESSHGHLNAQIPRRNDFYTSLTRLMRFIITKTHNFKPAYRTNLNKAIKKVSDRCAPFYAPIIEKEILQYNSTKKSCSCGETKLINSMMRVDIPCPH